MGAVYLAERADGHYEQRVAIKVFVRSLAIGERCWDLVQPIIKVRSGLLRVQSYGWLAMGKLR